MFNLWLQGAVLSSLDEKDSQFQGFILKNEPEQ
jgi:hypothetical protein